LHNFPGVVFLCKEPVATQCHPFSLTRRSSDLVMLRKLGCFLFAIGLVVPAVAANKPGTISGYVRTTNGAPQMGAMVEVLGSVLRSEEHTSELQSRRDLVCRLLH